MNDTTGTTDHPHETVNADVCTVLLVEDDLAVRVALAKALSTRGFLVKTVSTAADALRATVSDTPDLIVLDLGLPDLDGASALRMIRVTSNVPVIIASARGTEHSVVQLLNAGADDYMVKPFSSEHLAARMTALLRRTAPAAPLNPMLRVGDLEIDLVQRTVRLRGQQLELTRLEFDLLSYLAERPGQVVNRRTLAQKVWRSIEYSNRQTMDVHVSWLRRKLGESASCPRYLHTIRGVGLKLVAPG